MTHPKPGILLVLDGWGHAEPGDGNAIAAADTPYLDHLLATCPTVLVEASGSAGGLPSGTVGNSEIGHMVIGAGRPVPYDSVLVQQQIDSGELRAHPLLRQALADTGAALHLVGLCSDGAIHAHIDHLRELLLAAAELRVPRVWIMPSRTAVTFRTGRRSCTSTLRRSTPPRPGSDAWRASWGGATPWTRAVTWNSRGSRES